MPKLQREMHNPKSGRKETETRLRTEITEMRQPANQLWGYPGPTRTRTVFQDESSRGRMELVEELGLDAGMTVVVGAGGKKTALYSTANRLERALITTTVRIPKFDEHVDTVLQTTDPVGALESVGKWPVGLVPDYEEARYLGYDLDVVDAIAKSKIPEAVLVKGDGARNREFKAPGEDEPRIPRGADRVLAITSTHIVGEPLSEELVHRPEAVRELTGLEEGDRIDEGTVATVMASPEGGRKNVPDGTELVPVLNKVDDERDEAIARSIAEKILDQSPVERVALTRLIDEERQLVDVIT